MSVIQELNTMKDSVVQEINTMILRTLPLEMKQRLEDYHDSVFSANPRSWRENHMFCPFMKALFGDMGWWPKNDKANRFYT